MILRHLCLLLLASAIRAQQGQNGHITQYQSIVSDGADVIFVLDGSQRITPQYWAYLQSWLQNLMQYWNIGQQGIQVGFTSYGGGAQTQWTLKQAGNQQQAVHEIQSLTYSGGSATAGQAIRQAYREGFSAQNGGRTGVPKIIINVNNGPVADPVFFQQQVAAAKQSGVAVYNVGIGAGMHAVPTDASLVASEPSSRYVLSATNYQTMDTLTAPLAARVAGELPSGQGAVLSSSDTHACLQQADVAFLLDGSSSVGDGNFQQLLSYVKSFSSQLPVSQQGVHVGVMQFSNRPSVEFGLDLYTDKASLLKGIDNIHYMGGGTNTADALHALRTQMFSQTMGARPGVPRIAVVVTDGRSSSMADTVREADLARQNNIEVIAVGVGSGVNTLELQGIADNSHNVFHVDSFDQLPAATHNIMQRTCQAHATAAPLSATANPNDPCQDSLNNCRMYDANICSEYKSWATTNCAKTCGFCTSSLPDVLPPCTDVISNCDDYDVSVCNDPQYKVWATDSCALYCGLCGSGVTTNGYYGQCYYKGNTYSTGETWQDGCDYECTCENGETGYYKCYNKCPLYSQLPSECTLVQTPGKCCLEPVCNFNPTVQSSVTSGRGTTTDGMSVCERNGHQYIQGESWDEGCTLKCVCEDSASGRIRCQDYCPTYTGLPTNCQLQRKPGQCCSEPVCEFNTQTGITTGRGQTSGMGAVLRPTNPPPCVDTLTNCAQYSETACKAPYLQWARDNCRAFCGLCSGGQVVPSDSDRCTYQGLQYRQGETWTVGCDQECICEQAAYGYYRCDKLCPTYTNVPAACTRTPASNTTCCETITCPAGTQIITSTTNLLSTGSGNYILQPNPLSPNQLIPLIPTMAPGGGTVSPNQPYVGYQAPTIPGCVYKGQLYVQGQRWDDGCSQVCECTSASQGLYTCSARCPEYQNLPVGCTLQPDPADACCQVPVCQTGVNYVPIPVFNRGDTSTGVARPPNPNELMATSSSVMVTQHFPQSANSPPTMPPGVVPTGGIGYCTYKNQTYRQSETWVDGCDYNCLCQDASRGYWICSDMCLTYPPMPQGCRLVTDQAFPCCKKPYCEFTGNLNSIYGTGSPIPPTVLTTRPPMVITTTSAPRPAMCVYKNQEYSQGQEWYDGCDKKCACYDAVSNLFFCNDRCPTFFGLDETRCRFEPDPRDPKCCTIPVCQPPSTPAVGTTAIPSVTGGGFENTNSPGVVGFCEYKGTHYRQGDQWDDGCQYTCECLDATNGRYRCDEKCPRFPSLPSACRLVPDFANPCCQKPLCDFTGFGNTINGQAHVITAPPMITPAPGQRTPMCEYHGGEYYQGQTWDDGCDKKCRCEDAEKGLYVCDDRCAKYNNLPSQCVLVADPTDQCCRVPQCSFTPNTGQISGQGNPTPFPPLTPGQISGQVNVPTPGPGLTPAPVGFCVYKGVTYQQGQRWDDGCDYSCQCVEADIGKYNCDEKCAKYPNLPPQCRLFKDPANPCCTVPDCSFTPTAGTISGTGSTPRPQPGTTQAPVPGQTTVAPPIIPGMTTIQPNPYTTQRPATPSPTPVCVYRGQTYAEGQTWYDGCDYVCVCEVGSHGTYRCNDRCPSYPNPQNVKCTMKPDPADPMCCRIPECETPEPTPLTPNGPYVVPTIAPQGVVTGGSVTVAPTPGSTVTPIPGQPTQSPPLFTTQPPQPREVCVYKGQDYTQGQKWQDGCDYNCECVDAPNGHYSCTEMCPRYPPMPQGCYMVRDVYNPCCQTPVCPFPPTQTTTTHQPTPGVTQAPPTGPSGQTLMPPVQTTPQPQPRTCVYNGVPYRTGDTWDDGCDLRCRCENMDLNVYRCDQRCARYNPSPGCTMVTDPRDSCCLVPSCAPKIQPTQAPNPNLPSTPAPSQVPIPTAIPGVVIGNSVGNPNINNPDSQNMCVYNGNMYRQSETWLDGCEKTCICVDQSTGRYECNERCLVYMNIPTYCTMAPDPADACCEKPVCTTPLTVAPPVYTTQAPPGQVTQAPNPNQTPGPNPNQTPGPNPNQTPNPYPQTTPGPNPQYTVGPQPITTPQPQPRNVCTYKNAVYVQGQQWYDGCDKVCVCEDGMTGYYRCTDRCKVYDQVPAGCTLVVDPSDPQCCKVPQCAPTPGPNGYPTPPAGQSPTPFTVTNVPGIVTGKAPTPTPAPGQTPQPRNACVYKGRMYARGQQWQDGCDYKCVCDNEMTGEYTCTERCNSYPMVPPECQLNRDPNDFCCQIMTCDYSRSTPSPFLTASPQPSLTPLPSFNPPTQPPTPGPGETVTPRPIPVFTTQAPNPNNPSTPVPNPVTTNPPYVPQAFCVFNGVPYRQGATWQEGCSRTCRCDDADNNLYSCYDRCPKYTNLDSNCYMTLNPNDQCCTMPVCPVIPTYSPTPGPNATPSPFGTPSPTATPFPVPQRVPGGTITGTNPNPNTNPNTKEGFCVYMNNRYTQGQTWDDGCDYNCTCIDQMSGRYVCSQKCDEYPNVPSYCVLVKDPANPCCMKPMCTPPSTQTPPPQYTLTPPGQHTQTPLPGHTTPVPQPGQTVSPPYYTQPPFIMSTPSPRASVCVMNGRSYTQGQQWYDGCSQICVCEDGTTGYYSCRQRCPDYPDSDPTCMVVPDPSDPACCTIPQCTNPQNPDLPTGHKGSFTGSATPSPYITPQPGYTQAPQPGQTPLPPQTYAPGQTMPPGQTYPPYLTPQPGQTYAPGQTIPPGVTYPPGQTYIPNPGTTQAPQPRQVCYYKGQEYTTGQRWRDGCDYECVCEDGMTGQYKCTDRCLSYPPLTAANCRMERDPSDPCCQVPNCSPTQAPTYAPGQTPLPGVTQSPTASPNLVPNTAVCVYQGVPYRTGQSWNDGCDKVCVCEDGMSGHITCNDRCPSYPNTQAGCRMVTDPQDSCCQMPQCQNPNTNNPTQVITGVPGTIQGNNLPPTNQLNPVQPRANVCVYRGVEYQQGQHWDDGCSYTCVCEDGMTGHYTCTDRCARVPYAPPTCYQVPDPSDLCCQVLHCPTNNPQPLTTPAPTPYTGAPTQAPTPYHGPSTQSPPVVQTPSPNPYTTVAPQPRQGMCLYKNQYYRETQVWYDGCEAICTCEDGNTGYYNCQPRCGEYKNVANSCIMVPDPKDPQCCKMPECPLIPQGGTTPNGPTIIRPTQPTAVFTNFPTPSPQLPVTQSPPLGPNGQTLVPPVGTTQAPVYKTGCVYKGRTYQENEQWDDGCDYTCACLSDMTGVYQCSDKCARMPNVPQGCVMIQDPQDACCQVPYCDFGPNPFPNGIPTSSPTQVPGQQPTTPMVLVPGYVTVNGNQANTTPNPFLVPSITGRADVCVYLGVMYRQGDQWNDGCDKTCVCDANGLYNCRDRCQSFPNLDPACVLRPNPNDPCCLVPDCNPNYVTPGPNTGYTGSNPNITPSYPPGYTGIRLTPGPGTGISGTNPTLNPGTGGSFTGTRAPILVPTASPGVFTGQRPPLNGQTPTISGYSSMCVYKGATYNQGATWDDGCQFKCECIDALRGNYRCTERCSNMYFLPPECSVQPDPNDSCCQRAFCSPDAFPTPTPLGTVAPPIPHTTLLPHTQAPTDTTPSQVIHVTSRPGPVFQGTRSPVGSTVTSFTGKPPNMCVYTDGRTFAQGQSWTDGCAYSCVCKDASTNDYQCDFRCKVYSDIPSFCQLVNDPSDQCCQKVQCTPVNGKPLAPVIGDNRPTSSPTMVPSITNVIPIGTHTVISGSRLPNGETQPGFFGGREVCMYKGVMYQAGDHWDDGCDYTCTCLDLEPAVYSCTSKCPKYPPMPQYCQMVDVPGQCCPSMRCNIPDVGAYNPIPQLYPNLMPTQAPTSQPMKNPQLVVPGGSQTVTGGYHPPGGGFQITNPSTIGSITDRCVYQGTDSIYRVYLQDETWDVGTCTRGYTCECKDATSGFYECRPRCPDYSQGNLPASCSLQYVQGQCCPKVTCTNPDGTVTDPTQNPTGTKVPVYGLIGTGYSGFRPGSIPGHTNTINGQSNVCVYKGTPYHQNDHWDDGCDFTCDCTDASTGLYICKRKCPDYTALPSICSLATVSYDCCPKVQCTAPPTTAPPTTTQPPGMTSVALTDCTHGDKLSNCNQYDKATSCVGLYEPWARDNCPVYCGYCKDLNPTTPGPCVDNLPNCDAYGATACTGLYEPWARDNCAKTCNLCPCYDRLHNCDQYGAYACGGVYEAWARDNCAKTCGLCGHGPGQTGMVNPGVTSSGGNGQVPDGWTLLLKGVAGAPGDLWNLWSSPNTANTNVPAAQRLTSEYMGHYKPSLALSLDRCDFERIKVAIYNNGLEKANVIFDGRNTGRDDWFSSSRIISSTYSDIKALQQYLKMAGDPATGHEFFIGQAVSGCTGSGWMMVSTRNTCTYEAGTNPGFYYSATGTTSNFNSGTMQSGDVFAIMGEGGSCSLGVTTPHTFTHLSNVCVYKGHVYQQDEWWQDGCSNNCTCINATTGVYKCWELCLTYPSLPSQCSLIKQPGECCAKPTGPGCSGSSGCVYKGQLYQQGQTWDDGCDFTCQCQDATTGQYQCSSMCLNFQLPDVCHYDPAPAGMCCPTPVCPDNIKVQYPAGWTPR